MPSDEVLAVFLNKFQATNRGPQSIRTLWMDFSRSPGIARSASIFLVMTPIAPVGALVLWYHESHEVTAGGDRALSDLARLLYLTVEGVVRGA